MIGARQLSFGVLAQLISSGTTIILTATLAALASKNEFAAFSLSLSSATFFAGVGSAMVTTQMVVLFAHEPEPDRKSFLFHSFAVLLSTFLLLTTLATVAIFFIESFFSNEGLAKIVLLSAALGGSFMIRDFAVRLHITVGKSHISFVINSLVFALVLTFALLNLKLHGDRLSIAFVWAGSALIIGALSIKDLAASQSFRVGASQLYQTFQKLWLGGRFSLISHLIIFSRSNAYLFFVAASFSVSSVADINFARLFVAPILVFLPALIQVITPYISQLSAEDLNGSRLFLRTYTIRTLLLICAYGLISAFLFKLISPMLAQRGYNLNWSYFASWIAISSLISIRSFQEVLLIASREFKLQAISNLLGSIVLFISFYFFTKSFGPIGILYSFGISEGVVTTIYVIRNSNRNL